MALAGFASLVTVLGQRHSGGDFEVNVVRLRGMLETSLIALVFSLTPFLPRELGISDVASWRLASAFFALAGGARLAVKFTEGLVNHASTSLAYALVLVQALAIVLLASIAVGLVSERASGCYLIALFIYLSVSTIFFLRLVLSLVSSQRPAA